MKAKQPNGNRAARHGLIIDTIMHDKELITSAQKRIEINKRKLSIGDY